MKRATPVLILIGSLMCFQLHAQNAPVKFACISFNELLSVMPEFKKADTTLAKYRTSLEQQFDAMKNEYTEQAKLLSSPDTGKFTAPQLVIKKQGLNELLAKIQGFESEAGTLFNQKRSALLQPIQKKAEDAIQQVSKDNGYAFVFEKDNLHAYPPSTDILPLVKKKLGIM